MEIQKRRFAEEIAQAIQLKITRLGLEEGDRLPSHATLARELNVSIPSLREGLQMLATLGLLKISHGSGTIVAKPRVSDYFRILNSVLLSSSTRFEEYVEVRKLVEPYIASMVATQGGEYPRLQETLTRMSEAAGKNDVKFFRSEYIRFHHRLAKIAGNRVMTEIVNIVNTLLFSNPNVEKSITGKMTTSIQHHQELLDALRRGDAKMAEEIMLEHVTLIVKPAQIAIVCDTFSTGSIGGSFYTAGRELCRIIQKYTGITIESEPSQGGIENVDLTDEGKAILGLTQSDVAHQAFQGTGPFFDPHRQIRAICTAYNIDLWIVAADPSLSDLQDLRGKRIAMGTTGGESSLIAKAVLDAHGYKEGDYRPYYLSISNAVQGMKNKKIDVLFFLSHGPGSALSDLSVEREVKLLAVDLAYQNKILKSHPYWKASTISCSTWPYLDYDVPTLGISTLLITHRNVPEEIIKTITAAIMEHTNEIKLASGKNSELGEITAIGRITIPLHKGAMAYYREKGYNLD